MARTKTFYRPRFKRNGIKKPNELAASNRRHGSKTLTVDLTNNTVKVDVSPSVVKNDS